MVRVRGVGVRRSGAGDGKPGAGRAWPDPQRAWAQPQPGTLVVERVVERVAEQACDVDGCFDHRGGDLGERGASWGDHLSCACARSGADPDPGRADVHADAELRAVSLPQLKEKS